MAAPTYGSYQPGAVDPWQIESILAKEAITSPADAQGLLSSYAQQRQAQGYIYGQEADKQHQAAKDALTAQMAEARLKLIPEYLKSQAGAELVAPGAGLHLGDDISPDAAARSLQASRTAEFAKNIAEQGKGVESLSRAGQDVAIQQIPGLQNFRTTGAGQHSDITVEDKKAANALQIAAMHAKRGDGGSGDGTGFTMSGSVPNAYGGDDHFSAGKKVSQAKIDALREARGQRRIDPQTPAQDLPGGAGARSGTGTTAPTEAERKGVRTPPARSNLPQNAAAGVPGLQQRVIDNEANMQRQNPALYNDYVAGKARNNGKPDVRIENGRPVLYGGSGRPLN